MRVRVFLFALLIAGCSKPAEKQATAPAPRALSDEDLAARKLKGDGTDAELRTAGFSDKDLEVFRNLQGRNWKKFATVDPMDSHTEVAFSTFAQPIYDGWQSRQDIGVQVMIPCKKDIDVGVKTNGVTDGHVRLRFDDGPVQSEQWRVNRNLLLEEHSEDFVHRLLAAKTMKFEYTPKDSLPLVYQLSVLNLKDLMAQEPTCKFLK